MENCNWNHSHVLEVFCYELLPTYCDVFMMIYRIET